MTDFIEQLVAVAMAFYARTRLDPTIDVVFRYEGGWVIIPADA